MTDRTPYHVHEYVCPCGCANAHEQACCECACAHESDLSQEEVPSY